MVTKKTLTWVQQNKTQVDRSRPVGREIQRLVEKLVGGEEASVLAAVVATLNARVDNEFRCYCRVSIDDRGVLVIAVDPPPLVSVMRRMWERRLTDALVASRSVTRVKGIVFEHGVSGRRVPPVLRPSVTPAKEGSSV